MRNVQSNAISNIQAVCSELVLIRSKLTWLAEIYASENLASLTDEDFASIASFNHILATEFAAAMVALNAINTALNAGTPANWTKLLKLPETMPK